MNDENNMAERGAEGACRPERTADLSRPDLPGSLWANASIPVMGVDAAARMVCGNSYAADVLCIKRDTSLPLELFPMLSARDQSVLRHHLQTVIGQKQPARCELEWVAPGSGTQWVRLNSRPGDDGEGRSLCWATLEDITQIRRLEKTEALYQRAADIISKAESLADFSRHLFDLLRILFGIRNGYVAMVNSVTNMIEFPFHVDEMDACPAPHPMENGITEYVISMGRLVWLNDTRSENQVASQGFKINGTQPSDWIGVPLEYQGRVAGMVAVQLYEEGRAFHVKDVSMMMGVAHLFEVYLQRLFLEEKHHRLTAAIEQAAETVMITDKRGVILYVNPAFESITGFTRDQALGKTPALINSGRHSREHYRELWNTLLAGKTWRGHFTNRRKDGSLYEEEAVISPVRNPDGEIVNFVAVKRDLTHQSRLERHLHHAQRMEIIGRLAGGLHHEFSNILMAMRTHAERQLQAVPAGEKPDDVVRMVELAGRGEELVRRMSAFSAGQSDEPVLLDVNDVIQEFEPLARHVLGPAHSVLMETDPRAPLVLLTPGHLEQVLANLLMRAGRAMPAGGEIRVRLIVQQPGHDDGFQLVDGNLDARQAFVGLEVSDQGEALTMEQYMALFDPDQASHTLPGSQSLGMYTSLDLVRKNRGHIAVRPNVPSGSVFRVYFPVSAQYAASPLPLAEPEPAQPRGREVILLAEDDEGARRVIARMLQDHGYSVLEAENGAMAIRTALNCPKKIDLLLSDIMMPDFDGRALSEQVKGLQPDVKVVYISGYNQADLSGNAAPGHEPFLKKPFRRDELLRLVRQVLDGGGNAG